MKEIVLNKRKNGMAALIGIIVLLTISIVGFIFGCDQETIDYCCCSIIYHRVFLVCGIESIKATGGFGIDFIW